MKLFQTGISIGHSAPVLIESTYHQRFESMNELRFQVQDWNMIQLEGFLVLSFPILSEGQCWVMLTKWLQNRLGDRRGGRIGDVASGRRGRIVTRGALPFPSAGEPDEHGRSHKCHRRRLELRRHQRHPQRWEGRNHPQCQGHRTRRPQPRPRRNHHLPPGQNF